jgi:tetratricopeptide (TPR) repeat protein
MTRKLLAILFILLSAACASCHDTARTLNSKASMQLQAQDFAGALANYEKGLQLEPESKVLLFGKAEALFKLERYAEALPLFEEFITKASTERTAYSDELFDAEFYRDKCKQELGQTVEQNPDAIPPPRMGE